MSVQPMGTELGPPACLPANWKTVRFGDVCRIQGGVAFKSADYVKEGVPLVRISNLVNGRVSFDSDTVHLSEAKLSLHREFILKKGDTLIAMSGATTGKMATFDLDTPALLNQRVGRFRILSEDWCSPRFISLLVTQITKKVLKEAYGAAQPNISPTQIEQFEIPLPPLDEQLRIVAEIEKHFTRLEAGMTALRRVQANIKRYRAAVLKAACEGQLVATEADLHQSSGNGQKGFESGEQLLKRILVERRQWFDRQQADAKTKKKFVEPTQPETEGLQSLPHGWTWGTWHQLSNWVTYGFTRPMPHVDEGIPIITAKSVNKGRIDFDGAHLTTRDAYDGLSEKDRPQPGDILITKDGTIGRAAVVDTDREFCINQSVAVIWLRSCPMVRKFLLTVIESELTQKPIWAKARGVAIQHLSITDFAKMALPIPPLAEQRRIVAEVERRLSVVEQLEAVVSINLQRATRLRQSILQKAFTGTLTLTPEYHYAKKTKFSNRRLVLGSV